MGPSYQYVAKMIRVIDGDTYEVEVDLGFRIYYVIHVRLRAFDTAELRASTIDERAHAQLARDFVAQLLPPGTRLVLVTAKAAAYNRWEADVFYNVKLEGDFRLSSVLLASGFAKRTDYT